MEDLKSYYQEIEETFEWPEPPKGFFVTDQYYRLGKELRERVRERSLREKLDPDIYEERLNILLEFIADLRYSLNGSLVTAPEEKKNEQLVWRHQEFNQVTGFGDKSDIPKIDRNSLLNEAATYLSNPWLQNDKIDWIFIDSLIFAEVYTYSEMILSGQVIGKINWAYALSGGSAIKAYWIKLLTPLAITVLRYIIPVAIIYSLYRFYSEDAAMIGGGIYLAYLLYRIILWPKRYRIRKARFKIVDEHTERQKKMLYVYQYCSPPVISISTLRNYLNKAVDAGAIFEGALFSIINRVEENRGEAFMPFTESSATI